MLGLDYLVSPLSSDDFVSQYKGKKAVYIPGEQNKYENLFPWETVNDLLFSNRDFVGCRLIHKKKALPESAYRELEKWLAKGATFVINHVNRVDPLVEKFQAVLSYELNTWVNINAYMSCPSKQGFDIHFDSHDVFIVHMRFDSPQND